MRYLSKITALILSLVLVVGLPLMGCATRHSVVSVAGGVGYAAQYDEVSFGFFHNSLARYGHWVNIGSYGPCWRPANMALGWQPYYQNGYWAYTQYGWTWVSQDPWGDIVFHYGAWDYDPYYGWVWVPGYVWGPAWVTWVYTDFYIGWAPLPPHYRGHRHFTHDRPIIVEHNHYVIVPAHSINNHRLHTIRVPFDRNEQIVRNARFDTTIGVENNHVFNRGPDHAGIEKMRRTPTPLETFSKDTRMRPRAVDLVGDDAEIVLTAPTVNREQSKRVIRDFELQERGAKADRERQHKLVDRDRSEQLGVKPGQKEPELNVDREKRRVEREQPQLPEQREKEKIIRREEKDIEKLRKDQDQQYKLQQRQQQEQLQRQQQEQREREKVIRQQQRENEKIERQQQQEQQKRQQQREQQIKSQEQELRRQQRENEKMHKQQAPEQRRPDRNRHGR